MKKTNFRKSLLASSALLAIVALIALSTATFAWYTANSTVGVNATSIMSAESNAANLVISKNDTAPSDTTLTSVSILLSGPVAPMVPKSKPESGTSYSDFKDGFNTALTHSDGGERKFTDGSITTGNPAVIHDVWNQGESSTDKVEEDCFYLINTDMVNDFTGKATVTFGNGYKLLTGETEPSDWTTATDTYYKLDGGQFVAKEAGEDWAANTFYEVDNGLVNCIRVAMFIGGTYYNTWSGGDQRCAYGTITTASSVALNYAASDYATTASPTNNFDITANGNKPVNLVVWFDGTQLTVDNAGKYVTFSINFNNALA